MCITSGAINYYLFISVLLRMLVLLCFFLNKYLFFLILVNCVALCSGVTRVGVTHRLNIEQIEHAYCVTSQIMYQPEATRRHFVYNDLRDRYGRLYRTRTTVA